MKQLILCLIIAISVPLASYSQSTWVAPDSADALVNPFAGDGQALIAGKASFDAICFVCHGNTGKGDGLNAPNLERPPADLTTTAVQSQSDGALFWKISEGNPPMLSFKNSLSEEQRWQLVHYIRELAKLYPSKQALTTTSVENVSNTARDDDVTKRNPIELNSTKSEIETEATKTRVSTNKSTAQVQSTDVIQEADTADLLYLDSTIMYAILGVLVIVLVTVSILLYTVVLLIKTVNG